MMLEMAPTGAQYSYDRQQLDVADRGGVASDTAVGHVSTAGPANGSSDKSTGHKRVYQACLPCRRRKVRCDLGSVDNPDPPCVRCRRESKECYFSATRRKRRPADGTDQDEVGYDDDYELRNGRKKIRTSSLSGHDEYSPPRDGRPAGLSRDGSGHQDRDRSYSAMASQNGGLLPQPLTPGGSVGRLQPVNRLRSGISPSHSPHGSLSKAGLYASDTAGSTPASGDAGDDDHHVGSDLFERDVFNGHDALNLLFEAAGRTGDMGNHRRVGSQGNSALTPAQTKAAANHAAAPATADARSFVPAAHSNGIARPASGEGALQVPIDPAITNEPSFPQLSEYDPGVIDALRAWRKVRFVRAGWFSAREAMAYVHYFYEYMAPLTPVLTDTFQSPATHAKLLSEEPILSVTILTIASRYMKLPGPGRTSRFYAIHEKLWTYLRGMIERVVWGQEQFGAPGFAPSGLNGAGESQSSSTAPWRGIQKGSLRTLGTVESLLLLTEWHPRALHFPPGDDGDELILRDDRRDSLKQESDSDPTDGDAGPMAHRRLGGLRIEHALEPAWRSDRMCWMLLGNAHALAFELGAFDDSTVDGVETYRPERQSESYRRRAVRVQKLIYIYITQTAGRLEWKSMIGKMERARAPDTPQSDSGDHVWSPEMGSRKNGHPIPNQLDDSATPEQLMDTKILDSWIQITDLMKKGNEVLFPTRKVTRDLIMSGEYAPMLRDFQPRMRKWRQEFDSLEMPDHIRHVLKIEGEYVRVYINSLALQAVIDRHFHKAENAAPYQEGGASSAPGQKLPANTSLPRDRTGSVAQSTLTMESYIEGDKEFVKEVVEASRSLLDTVVSGLLPGNYLKHCPVRTYFRIISGAMFHLKTFALGAKQDEVNESFTLVNKTIAALRDCVVDDVHLGIRFAELLNILTKGTRSRIVRMEATKQASTSVHSSLARSAHSGARRAHRHGGARGPPQNPDPHQQAQPWPSSAAHHHPGPHDQDAYPPRSSSSTNPSPILGISSLKPVPTDSTTPDPSTTTTTIMPPPQPWTSYDPYNPDSHPPTLSPTTPFDQDVRSSQLMGLDLGPYILPSAAANGAYGAPGGPDGDQFGGAGLGGMAVVDELFMDMLSAEMGVGGMWGGGGGGGGVEGGGDGMMDG